MVKINNDVEKIQFCSLLIFLIIHKVKNSNNIMLQNWKSIKNKNSSFEFVNRLSSL